MLDSQPQQENQHSFILNEETKIETGLGENLVSKAANGDKQAFGQLIDDCYADIFSFSFHLIKNKPDAEDLTHDVVLKIAKSIGQFQFNCAFLSWVYRIVVNTHRDNYKKQANRFKRDSEFHDRQQLQQHSPQPDESVEFNELLVAIDQLPEKLKITLILVYAEHFSHSQVAEVLQCSINTVSWRIHEAKKQLKKILENQS